MGEASIPQNGYDENRRRTGFGVEGWLAIDTDRSNRMEGARGRKCLYRHSLSLPPCLHYFHHRKYMQTKLFQFRQIRAYLLMERRVPISCLFPMPAQLPLANGGGWRLVEVGTFDSCEDIEHSRRLVNDVVVARDLG
jgi:hypothetical protein